MMKWTVRKTPPEMKQRNAACEAGSMVLEAAMVLPLFMFFVIFLIYIIQMTIISTALQTMVSDSVKTVAAHIYPVSIAVQSSGGAKREGEMESGGSSFENASSSHWEVPKLSLQDWAARYSATLPEPVKGWMNTAAAAGDEPLQQLKNQAAEAVLDPVIKPMLRPFIPGGLLEYERIHVSNVSIPNLKSGKHPYFGIEVSYELPIQVPFLNRSIVLQAKSQERLWIGDTGEGGSEGDAGAEDGASGGIELLEKPNPAVASKQARVRAKLAPGTAAQMSVYYKSGKSTAKYLGWKTADEQGFIEWEWNVGFNTTPGSWPFVIETADGDRIEVMFTVVERP
ncbi:pilus assembly protein [Paenibacillus sp. F411]|uniref:TadE/TadG family type IV pilus assembly protein n=1 Tax=Paenibacillus sp. F411 TaxID=2820239 RepID=UPI001FBA66A1|nr:pilus assembly protein [Paenibacillus sp. F411]